MPTLKILLIEDTPADRVRFVDKLQGELGDDVQVDCAELLSEAFSYLESAGSNPYDQIWLDPELPDLSTQHVGTVLTTLKRHVAKGELRMLTATPEAARQAERHDVIAVDKSPEGSSAMLAIVKQLLEKRSGGAATVRVEQARQEGRILNIEQAIAANAGRIERLETALVNFSTLRFELESIKGAIAAIPPLQTTLSEMKKTQDQQGVLKLKRLDVLQAVAIALITGLLTVVIPKLIDLQLPKPTPTQSPSASPKS